MPGHGTIIALYNFRNVAEMTRDINGGRTKAVDPSVFTRSEPYVDFIAVQSGLKIARRIDETKPWTASILYLCSGEYQTPTCIVCEWDDDRLLVGDRILYDNGALFMNNEATVSHMWPSPEPENRSLRALIRRRAACPESCSAAFNELVDAQKRLPTAIGRTK